MTAERPTEPEAPDAPDAPAGRTPRLIYLGRNRLHRSRANLIQTFHTVHALTRLGVDVELQLPPWPNRVSPAGVSRRLGIGPVPARPYRLLHPRFRFHAHVRLQRRRLLKADAVYTRTPEIAVALVRARVPATLEVHDTDKLAARGHLALLAAAHASGRLRALTPISRAAAATLISAGADPDRVHVLPSGVDVAAFTPPPDDPPPAPAALPLRTAYLGRINAGRGQAVLLALHRRGVIRLTLVGEQDDAVPEVPGLERLPFVPQTEVPSWYRRCDVVLLPYQPSLDIANSVSPIKLFEAMAAGRPVVASALPTLREVVRDGENGLLVEPGDTDAWAAACRRLVQEPGLAERLGRRAMADAIGYDWSSRARALCEAVGLKRGTGR